MTAMPEAAGDERRLILFDDGRGRFGPLCDLRPVFDLRTGALTTAERLARRFGPVAAVRAEPALAEVVAEAWPGCTVLPKGERFLLVNGRAADCGELTLPAPGEALMAGDDLVAATVTRREAEAFLERGLLPEHLTPRAGEVPLLKRPWDLLNGLARRIAEDIAALAETGADGEYVRLPDTHQARMGGHPILVHREAVLAPQIVLDASGGPILIGPKAVLRPFSVLIGPCAIGGGTIVTDRSLIKAATACGPHCRLGGEIGGTSIAGYSNKSHDGHLGDSIVGEWVNLGAGTDNSNLLNTYGEVSVRLEPNAPRERTGRIFFGSVVGDHVKCAIGTRLMTGTVLGTGAMIATTAPPPTSVARFAWLVDPDVAGDTGESRYRLSRFLAVLDAVFARRSRTPGAAYRRRIEALYASSDSGS